MNRLPWVLRSTPPSPRTDSVTSVPVTGVLPGVARHLVRLADPASGQHHGRRLEDDEVAGLAVIAERARDAAVDHEQLGDRALVEDPQPRLVVLVLLVVLLLQRDDLLLQRADHLQPGAVRSEERR